MKVMSNQKTDTNTVELEIAVSGEKLEEAVKKVYERKAKNINVPGFRKGKAPRKIIEQMYGEGVFLEDAVNELYPAAYSEAIEETNLEPVGRAEVQVLSLDKNDGFTFKAVVTTKPEVTVDKYKGVKVEKNIYSVNDADIDHDIFHMRDRNSRLVSVENRAAENNDQVIIDFEGFVDGVAFEGGKGDAYQLTLGSHSFIDTFEEQIIGHNINDEFEVNVTFPTEYHVDDLKDKPAVFKVKLIDIKAKELPEVDDEFVKDVSEFDTVAELKADIEKKLKEKADERSKTELENSLIDKVIENLTAEIPEVMFESRIDEMVGDFEQRLKSQGMALDMYLQYVGMEMESFRKTFREQAERQVKIRLALEQIAINEKIEITEEELETEYNKLAELYKMEAEQIKGFVPAKELKKDLAANKAIDFVRDNAKVTEKEASMNDHADCEHNH